MNIISIKIKDLDSMHENYLPENEPKKKEMKNIYEYFLSVTLRVTSGLLFVPR